VEVFKENIDLKNIGTKAETYSVESHNSTLSYYLARLHKNAQSIPANVDP
jgi:IS1 family transposase